MIVIEKEIWKFKCQSTSYCLGCVDFGVHVADNKTVYKTITVKNSGSTPAPYKIDYKGKYPISFSPQSAVVQPNSTVPVEVR